MSEMIERVARAIFDAAEKYGEYVGDYQFHKLGDHLETTLDGQFDLSVLARAALEAMREPTEEMTKAAYVGAYEPGDMAPFETWPKMIDAALKEGA